MKLRKKDYEIFQITCADCLKIYDVRTYHKGDITDIFPCDELNSFSEYESHGYCPPCLEDLMGRINRKSEEIKENERRKSISGIKSYDYKSRG